MIGASAFRDKAIQNMRSPYEMKIICINITNKCDLACSNCFQLLENQDALWEMSLQNFRIAARSLDGFPGVIAVVGGNPTMHRNFLELCEIFVEEVPNKKQRGLWTNNVFRYNEITEKVFGVFHLNPHGSQRGIQALESLRPRGRYYEGYSSHSPVLTAGRDLFEEEE